MNSADALTLQEHSVLPTPFVSSQVASPVITVRASQAGGFPKLNALAKGTVIEILQQEPIQGHVGADGATQSKSKSLVKLEKLAKSLQQSLANFKGAVTIMALNLKKKPPSEREKTGFHENTEPGTWKHLQGPQDQRQRHNRNTRHLIMQLDIEDEKLVEEAMVAFKGQPGKEQMKILISLDNVRTDLINSLDEPLPFATSFPIDAKNMLNDPDPLIDSPLLPTPSVSFQSISDSNQLLTQDPIHYHPTPDCMGAELLYTRNLSVDDIESPDALSSFPKGQQFNLPRDTQFEN